MGTEQVYMDYNVFDDAVKAAAKKLDIKLSAAQRKTICRAMSVVDSEAAPVISKVLKRMARNILT